MKVCVVIPNFYPAVVYGGWVFSSINTCRELAKLGIQSYVSTTNDNGQSQLLSNGSFYKKIEENIFVKYYPQTIKERFSFSMLLKLRKDIRSCDIIHIQGIFSAPTPIGLLYATLQKKKIVLSPHGCLGMWCLADGSKFKKTYLKYFIKPFAEKIWWHATSQQEKNEILFLFPNAQVEIIPNGINMEDFEQINKISRSEFLEKYTGTKEPAEQILISMSRLHKKKGLDILLQAFSSVIKKFPTSKLLIAGDDFGEKTKLLDLVDQLNLNSSVFFVGHLKDQERVDFFANADVFVLPSHNENFGLVFAEAMAAGTPVIASKGTPWEEVEQLKIGRWVENNPEITAHAIEEMLMSNTKEMGEASKVFVKNNYSWNSIGNKFKLFFERISQNNLN